MPPVPPGFQVYDFFKLVTPTNNWMLAELIFNLLLKECDYKASGLRSVTPLPLTSTRSLQGLKAKPQNSLP